MSSFCIQCRITCTIKVHTYAALVVQCDATCRIIKLEGAATSCGKALAVVALTTATTSCSIKQATHNVRSCRVTMSEAEEDLVAYLWDKHKTTVALYVTTATTIWCHHTHPASLHAIRLPIHTHTHTALTLWVSIAKHGCHLCLSQWHTHLWTWQCLYRCRDSLKAVFVVAALAHLMGYFDNDKVTQALF